MNTLKLAPSDFFWCGFTATLELILAKIAGKWKVAAPSARLFFIDLSSRAKLTTGQENFYVVFYESLRVAALGGESEAMSA